MTLKRILHRRGTAAAWVAANPILALSELGYETDTGKYKFGNGVTHWNALQYRDPETLIDEATGLTALVEAAVAAATADALDDAGILRGVSELSVENLVLAIVDALGQRSDLELNLAGKFTDRVVESLKERMDIPGAIVDFGAIVGYVLTNSSLSFALTDALRRRSDLELGLDGKFTDRVVESLRDRMGVLGSVIPEMDLDDHVFLSTPTGERTLLGTVTGGFNPTLLSSTEVRVETATLPKWLGIDSPTPGPLFPIDAIADWGDSLTWSSSTGGAQASPTWSQTLATILGVPVYNGGLSAHGTAEIATRQGGLQPLCTLTGNQIPAGSVTPILLTAISPTTGWRISANPGSWLSMAGSLGPVVGILRHDLTDPSKFYFIPSSPPVSTVAIAPGTPFIGSEGIGLRDRINILWGSANNASQISEIVRDHTSMVNHQTAYIKRYLVISNTQARSVADPINTALQTAFPEAYVDLRGHLIANGLALAGITPTGSDATDIAAGNVPGSLTVDGLHFKQAVYDVIGQFMADVIVERNWIVP